MSGALKRRILLSSRVAVSILSLWFLFALYSPRDVFALLVKVGPGWFVASVLLYGACICVGAWKWRILLPVRTALLLRAVLASCFYSMLPSGLLGGELSKVLIVKSAAPDAENVLASIMFDKLSGVMALLSIALLALGFSDGKAQAMQFYAITLLAAGCVAFLAFSPLAAKNMAIADPTAPFLRRALGSIPTILHSIDRFRRDRSLFARSYLLGLLSQCVLVSVYLVLAYALDIGIGPFNLIAAVSLANLATLLPISIGGFGVREAGLTALLTASYAIPGEQALALSLSAMGVFVVAALAGGVSEFRSIARKSGVPAA